MADLSGNNLNSYLLGQRIGSGAMGEVYQAYPDLDAKREMVAVKVLHPEFAKDAAFKARFEREMRLMQALEHPHIVPLLDFGVAQGYLYIVMKLINGITLSRLMRKQHFSPKAAWNILKPLAAALTYGHEQYILHRDIKPSNVLLEHGSWQVYLMDFGLGKKPGFDTTLTATGVSIGTPEYMSPEAALGEDIDYRTDIYSLAVMLYELLLGVLPFDYEKPHLTALAHLNETPPHPCQLNPAFPAALAEVILRSLAKAPAERHQSVQEFADDFSWAISSLSEAAQEADYWLASPQA